MSVSQEIEIKCLLGSKENADAFEKKILIKYPAAEIKPLTKQLNHYFIDGDFACLKEKIAPFINESKRDSLDDISLSSVKSFSIRTREMNDRVLFVIKISLGDDSSSNGVARMEFEEEVPLTLGELDNLVLSCGFSYQAKWSRERVEYILPSINICLDKNAGYGYLTEFEKIVGVDDDAREVKDELMKSIAEFGLQELPQDRLERMFAHYNGHWQEYYGTDKTFTLL